MHPTNKSSSKNNNNETEHVIPDGVLALLLTTPNANADDKEKYKLFAEETRKEVWALKLPEFTNTAVPDKYKDESAVILAAHSRLEITKKTRFNVGAFLGGFHYIDREVNCRDLYRMLVQINDKAALKEFSEFDYKAEIRKKTGGTTKTTSKYWACASSNRMVP